MSDNWRQAAQVRRLRDHAVKYFNEHGYRIVKLRERDVLTLGGQWIRLPQDLIIDELTED